MTPEDAAGGDDETVVQRPGVQRPGMQRPGVQRPGRAPRRGGRGKALAVAGGGLVALAIAVGAFLALRPRPPRLAGEAAIFHHVPKRFTVFRFRPDPRILVIDCPGLHQQGLMFDRIAALIEKAGVPKDRVLSEAQFAAVLARTHQTIGTYYYGNDYDAAALRRFYRLARAEGIGLTAQETRLRRIIRRAGFLAQGATGAVISLPRAGPGRRVGLRARAVILRHELSHGAYYTNAAYRRFVARFVGHDMTAAERQDFVAFLGRQGYDTGEHWLMVNETQAYLVFTPDREFFRASAVGLTPATVDALRRTFIASMPDFWLRRLATAPLPGTGSGGAAPKPGGHAVAAG